MKKYKKLAMFGGTFSPIHNGHIAALKAYGEEIHPDVVYIVPTATPPHKVRDDTVSDSDRIEMINLALNGFSIDCEIVISDIEFKRGGKSYTVDTVKELLKIAEKVFFFCGTDMLLTVDMWHEHKKLLSIASIAYMQREDDLRYDAEVSTKARELTALYGTEIVALPPVSDEISSSMVREAVYSGQDITHLVPKNVAEYIAEHHLYK